MKLVVLGARAVREGMLRGSRGVQDLGGGRGCGYVAPLTRRLRRFCAIWKGSVCMLCDLSCDATRIDGLEVLRSLTERTGRIAGWC